MKGWSAGTGPCTEKAENRIGRAELPVREQRLDDLEAVLIVPATPRPVESRRDAARI